MARGRPARRGESAAGLPAQRAGRRIPAVTTLVKSSAARMGMLIGVSVAGIYLAHAWSFSHVVNDDAYITFRYSLNWAAGIGPYFNAGEHVEGYTNFLLMGIVAALIHVGGPDVAAPAAKAIGVVGGLLAVYASHVWTRRRWALVPAASAHATWAVWAAPLMVAINGAFALNSVTGLETSLFAGLLATGLMLLDRAEERERWSGAGVAMGLAALTRPEGAILSLGALLAALAAGGWRRASLRRALALDLAIVIGVVALHAALRMCLYDGEWLPNTYYAKTGGPMVDPRSASYLWGYAAEHLGGPLAALPLLVLASRHVARAALPGLVVCVLACLQIVHTGPDWMLGYRPLGQYLPVWSVLAVLGIAAATGRRALVGAPVACLIALVALLARFDVRAELYRDAANSARGYQVGHAALADWLRERAAPGDAVALMDIGLIGYRNPALRMLDISGLTDRHIARAPGALFQKQYDPMYVLDQAPRFIVLIITRPRQEDGLGPFVALTPMEGRIANHPRFRAGYVVAEPPPRSDDPLEEVAALFGAVRIFEHADPKHIYLLAVFERKTGR